MRRVLLAAFAAVLAGAVVIAQEKLAQPVQPRLVVAPAARVAALEEEVETLEAHRDVKKAYIRAAEVGVEAAKARYELVTRAGGAASATEVTAAKYDLEMAKAQLDIRTAEAKEVEVKIKHAKKRLEDATAGGGRPAPAK